MEEALSAVQLYVDSLVGSVTNLGPGRRIALWVQGCTLGCPGCMTPELFGRREADATAVSGVAAAIGALAPGHDGLTVSGGEPFQQAAALAVLLQQVRASTDLDVMVYSGYTIEEIRAGNAAMGRLLAQVDILVDGRFQVEAGNRKLWRGSDNQRIHLLTPRAERYRPLVDGEYEDRRPLHVHWTPAGELRIVGIPARGFVAAFRQRMAGQGIALRRRGAR